MLNYPALRLVLALKLFREGAFHFDYLGIVLQHDLMGRFLLNSRHIEYKFCHYYDPGHNISRHFDV